MNLHEVFTAQFGGEPTFAVRSPGRVNLIGEHVDYNDGFVLPMAVPMQTDMVLRERDDDRVVLYSPLFDDRREFSLNDLQKQNAWIDYVQGVAQVLQDKGIELRGFEGVVSSNIPIASGLSSSASIEVAASLAFLRGAGVEMSRPEIALASQKAENTFVGVNCGIMDQMAVAACTKDNALLLDCRSLDMRQVPFVLQNHAVVVTDSAAPRELASSAYNERRAQCEEGLVLLQEYLPEAKSLRDVSVADFEAHKDKLPKVVANRVEHIVHEINRTQEAVAALEAGDLQTFGARMNDSHASLRDLYEVTSEELDFLTDFARNYPGVLGSRMTGAGFGGCTVTLIEKDKAEAFIEAQHKAYQAEKKRNSRGWVCEAAPGAELL